MTADDKAQPSSAAAARSRVSKRRWPRVVMWCLIALLGSTLAAHVFELRQRRAVRNRYRPPGDLVTASGRTFHVVDQGAGPPTVVFESGLGAAGTQSWSLVQPTVSAFARTISYDRLGYTWSDRVESNRASETICRELFALLRAIEARPPYILVGHSMGGIHARVFADRYPELVSGIVLVDASHPDQESRLPTEMVLDPPNWKLHGFRLLADLGVFRFVDVVKNVEPKESERRNQAFAFFPSHVDAIIAEIRSQDANFLAARKTTFGDLPIRVVTAGRQHPVWHELQADLLDLSTNSEQTIVWTSGHRIPLEDPTKVVDAIKNLVEIAGLAAESNPTVDRSIITATSAECF